MSACLPGVSDPTRSSRWMAAAPSIVANWSTSWCVSFGANAMSGVGVNSSIRSKASAVRICVNISPGTLETTSTLSEERTPRSRSLPIGGRPCPISISTYVAIDTVPPVSAIQSSSWSLRSVQWMYVTSGPIRPRSCMSFTGV